MRVMFLDQLRLRDGVLWVRGRNVEKEDCRQQMIFVATRFSHNGGLLHEELVDRLNR